MRDIDKIIGKWGAEDGPSTQRRKSEQSFGGSKKSESNFMSRVASPGSSDGPKKTEDKPSKEG